MHVQQVGTGGRVYEIVEIGGRDVLCKLIEAEESARLYVGKAFWFRTTALVPTS